MTSDEETTKIKVVDFEKIYNFVVNNISILIHLESQTLILILVEHNVWKERISDVDTNESEFEMKHCRCGLR